ncbi:uncharacterized protein LOC131429153 [Malaya genurostris]|uniref:uncharacterized protein LOC131429153 n=1 Tax=Malaya genurostris TaxID=325434 RepID=UPI0026F393D1|nr:uncharacterized protein LOC131429153 [Malaya genurostris]
MESAYQRWRNNELMFTKLHSLSTTDCTEEVEQGDLSSSEALNDSNEFGMNREQRKFDVSVTCADFESDTDDARFDVRSMTYFEAGNHSQNVAKHMKCDESFTKRIDQCIEESQTIMKTSRISENIKWNLVTVISLVLGFVISELILKPGGKLCLFLKRSIEQAGSVMWNHVQVNVKPSRIRERTLLRLDERPAINLQAAFTVALIIPVAILLSLVYSFVWLLHVLNAVLLIRIDI